MSLFRNELVSRRVAALKSHTRKNVTIYQSKKIMATELEAFNTIERFCCFIGQPRSGHSLVGALLNAHPNMVIAHECDILQYLDRPLTKELVFSILLHRDLWFTNKIGSNWTGYSYGVPNQHQGSFEKLKVIGDKKGGITATRLYEDPECLSRLYQVIKTPMRIINYIRNPYDSISTEWFKFQHRTDYPNKSLELQIELFFQRTEGIQTVRRGQFSNSVMDAWHEEFVANPKIGLKNIVTFLEEDAAENYLKDCTSIIFNKVKKTSSIAPWTDELRDKVNQKCMEYNFLNRYVV